MLTTAIPPNTRVLIIPSVMAFISGLKGIEPKSGYIVCLHRILSKNRIIKMASVFNCGSEKGLVPIFHLTNSNNREKYITYDIRLDKADPLMPKMGMR